MSPPTPSHNKYFVPIDLQQIKRELYSTADHESEGLDDTLSKNSTELNNSLETEHNVREEDIKDEPMSDKELESDDENKINIDYSDLNDANNETLTGEDNVIREERERMTNYNVDVHVEEMKTEVLEETDDGESAGAAPAEKCRETLAEEIQDGSTLTPGGENVKESRTLCTVVEETTSRDTGRYMSRSVRIHLKRIFVCDDCREVFDNKNVLIEHIREQHVTDDETGSKELHECKVSEVRLRPKGGLKKHLKIHTGERPYECKICKVKFSRKSNLKIHLRIHTGEKPYECAVCKVRYKDTNSLKYHLKVHTGEKPYQCKICKVRFILKGGLKDHLKIHTGEKPYECEICKVRFIQKGTLKSHLRIHTGEKPYECEICKVSFTQKGSLKKHLGVHTGEKPFECEICKVSFRHKSYLKTHLYIHTGEKPYECEICKVRFRGKSNLKIHLKIHTCARYK